MSLARIILITLILIWAIIPFRQYKERYFGYFLILALMDPLAQVNFFLLKNIIPLQIFFVIFSFFLLISLFNKNTLKKLWYLYLIIFSALVLVTLLFIEEQRYLIVFLHLIIFYLFLKRTIINILETNYLNLFYFILLFYEASVITKFLVRIIDVETGWAFFYITNVFQILIGVFFIIYKESTSPKLSFKLDEKVE